MYDKR